MMRWILILGILALVGIGAAIGRQALTAADRSPMRGINYVSYSANGYGAASVKTDLAHLADLGVQWVAIVVTWYQPDRSATEIAPDPERTPSDASVRHVLNTLEDLDLNAALRPMVDIQDGTWRGEIAFDSERAWSTWFSEYATFMRHYAGIAERAGVDLLSVGVELEKTVQREREWRNLIGDIREIYSGPLTYAANWDGFTTVPFWDGLDYVGIDAYFELDVPAETVPTVDELADAWNSALGSVERFAERTDRPVLFTEIGVPSVLGNSRRPWDWTLEAPRSLREQANYYEAALTALWDEPWLRGLFWWAWLPGSQHEGPDDLGYSPEGKPAEWVLKYWYSR